MSEDETYNGWKNRETWAFCLHIDNDQGLYNETLEQVREWEESFGVLPSDLTDYQLGEYVVNYWRDLLDTYAETASAPLPEVLTMFDREVGSWWRIDRAEVGASVRESLDNES